MKKCILLFCLLFSALAFGQGAWIPGPATTTAVSSNNLVALPGAKITACGNPATGQTSSTPCTNTVTTYTSSTLATPTSIGACTFPSLCNPQTTDAQGNFGFWVPPGLYQLSECVGTVCVTSLATQAYAATNAAANNNFTGIITTQSINGDLWVGSGVGQYSSLTACYAAAVTGQVCHVTAGWTDPTWTANLVMSKNNVGFIFHGPAAIPMSTFSLVVNQGVIGWFISGLQPFTNRVTLGSGAAVRFTYTGTTDALVVGGSSGDTIFGKLDNVSFDASGGGSNANGIHLLRAVIFTFTNVQAQGNLTNGNGFLLDGTNNYTGNGVFINCFGSGKNSFNSLVQGNLNTIIGGDFSNNAASGVGINITNGNGNTFLGVGLGTGATTGISLGNSSTVFGNRFRGIYDQGSTTNLSIGAAAIANDIDYIGFPTTGPTVTDNSPIGANNVSWRGQQTVLNYQPTTGSLTGNQTIYTYTVPGNTLMPGHCLTVTANTFHATGTASITYALTVGGSTVGSQASTGVDNTATEYMIAMVCNNAGVQNAQNGWVDKFFRTANVTNLTLNLVQRAGLTNPSANFAGNVVIALTATGAGGDTYQGGGWEVKLR